MKKFENVSLCRLSNGYYRYDIDDVKRVIDKANEKGVFGTVGKSLSVQLNLEEVAFKCTNLRINEMNNELVGDISLLDTPSGRMLDKLIESLDEGMLKFSSVGTGSVTDGEVQNFHLLYVSCDINHDAF
jgi:hypothetical protein